MASATETLSFLLQVFEAVLKDSALAFPAYASEFQRDFRRLARLTQDRGLHALMADLPALAKHLDRCLAEGEYKLSDLALGRAVSKRVRVPKLFRALYLQIFESSGRLKDDYNVEAVLFLRQILLLAKKFEQPCSPEDVRTEVRAFLDVEDSLPEPHTVWAAEAPSSQDFVQAYKGGFTATCTLKEDAPDHGIGVEESFRLLEALDYVSGVLASTLGPYDPSEWQHRHGPGAVSERPGTFNKYQFSNWSARLDSAFSFSDHAVHDYMAWVDEISRRECSSLEHPSRMIAVPKTLLKPRLIAAEPTEHVWCQQNLRHYMYSRFDRTWIRKFVRLKDRDLNRDLARSGSSDGQLATVDLSAASDRVTCDVVGSMFRSNPGLLRALHACRTRSMVISQDLAGQEETISLKKFSTMGSAVTFPVETLWFLCVTLSAVLVRRKMAFTVKNLVSLAGEVAVYGDDIVVPVDSVKHLLRGLELTFSKPNPDKTFWTGMFRESCGLDSLGGVDVSPTYLNRVPERVKPESIASCIDTRNNFHRKWFRNVVQLFDQRIEAFGIPVPHKAVDSGSFGLSSFVFPFSAENPPKGARWNRELQRYEVKTVCFKAVSVLHPIEDNSALLQYFTEDPAPTTKWESGWRERSKLKFRLGWAPCSDYESSTLDFPPFVE